MYTLTCINNNKTYIYHLYALVFVYTFINNNNVYTYNLYALVFTHGRLHSSSSSSVDEVQVPATKRLATKCPRDEMVGGEVSSRRNARRRSVHATKWLATKCTGDEMAGDETSATKRDVPQLGKVDKLTYLRDAIKGGPAMYVIQGLTQTAESYPEAIKCLHDRYDRPRITHLSMSGASCKLPS